MKELFNLQMFSSYGDYRDPEEERSRRKIIEEILDYVGDTPKDERFIYLLAYIATEIWDFKETYKYIESEKNNNQWRKGD